MQEKKLKESLLPSLNLLTESSRIHRETRKFLRVKVSTAELFPHTTAQYSTYNRSAGALGNWGWPMANGETVLLG